MTETDRKFYLCRYRYSSRMISQKVMLNFILEKKYELIDAMFNVLKKNCHFNG